MYSRFEALQNYGEEEKKVLQQSTVAVIGLGATGSVIAENLARHGVDLKIIDRDYLESNDVYSSNIYTPEQCEESLPKAEAAREYLSRFTDVETRVESLSPDNIEGILQDVDLIVDGTDNLETRLLISEFSQKEGLPWIYTAAIAEQGYSMLFDKKCFNCIFEKVSPGKLETCETAGVLREISGQTGLKSAEKAVKLLAGMETEEKLDVVHKGESLDVESDGCKVCHQESLPRLNGQSKTTAVCGENKYQVHLDSETDAGKLEKLGDIIADNEYLTRAEIDGREVTVFEDGRVILNARDRGHAEALVSEILGL
ncbi:hypothetical protein GKQ38_02945 [Candidatus Nanohaloarchaea archaeon]|nr:hypothetical protein GKQ38_02945 [Candidatus Nanohaloarchaea archaeon]